MLSINALILSFLLGSGIPRVEEEIHFLIPSFIIILTSILSIIFATLSTRPKVTHGHLSKEEIESKMGNLLFFGNFHAMDLEIVLQAVFASTVLGHNWFGKCVPHNILCTCVES